jgi:hypothetical protein
MNAMGLQVGVDKTECLRVIRLRAFLPMSRFLLLVFTGLSLAGEAVAATRDYAWNYGATTYAEGDVELQTWLTFRQWFGSPPGTACPPATAPCSRLVSGGDINVGTIVAPAEQWEIAAYTTLEQSLAPSGKPSSLSADYGALQVRRQLTPKPASDQDKRPFDVLVMGQFEMPFVASQPRGYGAMVLVAGEAFFDPVKLVANLELQSQFDSSGANWAVDASLGALYRLSQLFEVGLEAVSWNPLFAVGGRRVLYLGPTLNLQAGRFWGALSVMWGADKSANETLFDQIPTVVPSQPLGSAAQTFNGFWARLLIGVNL